MIRHQAIGPDFHPALPAPLRHQRNIGLVIFIMKKGRQSAIAPLGDMVGNAGCYDPSNSSHAQKINTLSPLAQDNN
jgi:hypothetical protein